MVSSVSLGGEVSEASQIVMTAVNLQLLMVAKCVLMQKIQWSRFD
jgi:hypothetical protein